MIIKSELGGKTQKHKGNSKEKDCLTKKLILETISVDPLTAREIYERSGYTGTYKTLTGILGRYQRFGYIAREGKIPYYYFLTDLGFQHLENPFLGRDNAVRAYKSRMVDALVKYADSLDDETVSRIFKDRIIPPTLIKTPDKVTVKAVNENIKVIDSKPAMTLPKPSDGLSGNFDTSDYDKTIAELLEENKRLKEDLKLKEDEDASEALGKEIGKASEIKPVHIPRYNNVLLAYKNRVLDAKFFKKVPYKMLILTASCGKGFEKISQAVKDTIKEKFGKSRIIILPSIQVKPFVEFGYARLFTDEDFKKYKPRLLFGKDRTFVHIALKGKVLDLELCDLPVAHKVIIKPPKDVQHSSR